MSSVDMYYMQLNGITGPVTVSQFNGYFELAHFSGGDVMNQFSRTRNGPAFNGVPQFTDVAVRVKGVDGATGSAIYKNVVNAQPYSTIIIASSTVINGTEQPNFQIQLTNAFIHSYEENKAADGIHLDLIIGSPETVQRTFYKYDDSGNPTPYVVNYNFATSTVS